MYPTCLVVQLLVLGVDAAHVREGAPDIPHCRHHRLLNTEHNGFFWANSLGLTYRMTLVVAYLGWVDFDWIFHHLAHLPSQF